MTDHFPDYNPYLSLIETYASKGYAGIDRSDSLVLETEQLAKKNNQFFYIGDLIQMKVIFVSNRSREMIGIEPEELSPYHFFEATHPDDLLRHSLGRSQLFRVGHELFTRKKGSSLLSTTIRLRNPSGGYSNVLLQLYFFYHTVPYESVFLLKIHTNIDWFKKRKHGFHYYLGNDMSYFRFPDDDLLMTGIPLSDREFEIVKMVESGMGSELIAEKLFISLHTVSTHRRNILEKTGKGHISEVIYDLKAHGVL